MDRCQHCQEQMLDYLYELLDESEQVVLEAHLSQCEACQQAMHQAQGQQHLLASAARLECEVRPFEIPTEPLIRLSRQEETLDQPRVQPLPHPLAPGAWAAARPWLVAAVALVLLFGAGLYARQDHQTALAQVEGHQAVWRQQQTELVAVQQRQHDVQKNDRANRESLDERERLDDLVVQITGPETVGGSRTAPFRVETRDALGRSVEAKVQVELERKGAAPVPLQTQRGGEFCLPEGANLPPGTHDLRVLAERPQGAPVTFPVSVQVQGSQAVTYLTTDRPSYQAGSDVLHYRSLTLDRQSLRPIQDPLALHYSLKFPDGHERPVAQGLARLRESAASDALVRGPDGQALTGIGSGTLAVVAGWPAGEYALIVREGQNRFSQTTTRFAVTRPSRLRLAEPLTWGHVTYRPGDPLWASARLTGPTGEPLRNQRLAVRTVCDGQEADKPQTLTTDATGRVDVQSRLLLGTMRAELCFSLVEGREGDRLDDLRVSVPVFLPAALVTFFPEGGDLVAGVENRVYFQARDRRDLPVQLTGELLEEGRPTGVKVATRAVPELGEASGLGFFRFTPKANKRYSLRVSTPVETPLQPLPVVEGPGITMTVENGVVSGGESLQVRLSGNELSRLQVILTCREEVLAIVPVAAGMRAVQIPTRGVRGVARLTVLEEVVVVNHQVPSASLASLLFGNPDPLGITTLTLAGVNETRRDLLPRAERLIFCRPVEQVHLEVRKSVTNGADQARYSLQARDEKNQPTPAIAQVGVVDRALLARADGRWAQNLTTFAWLTSELVNGPALESADALLPADASASALDLVLGTRGWRRFETVPGTDTGTSAEGLVLAEGQRRPDYATLHRERTELDRATREHLAALDQRESVVLAALQELQNDPTTVGALTRLAWYQNEVTRWGQTLLPILCGLLGLSLVGAMWRLLRAELEAARPWLAFASTLAAVLVCSLVITPPLAIELTSPSVAVLIAPASSVALHQEKAKETNNTEERRLAQHWIAPELPKAGENKPDVKPPVARSPGGAGVVFGQTGMPGRGHQAPNAPRDTNAEKEAELRQARKRAEGIDRLGAPLEAKDLDLVRGAPQAPAATVNQAAAPSSVQPKKAENRTTEGELFARLLAESQTDKQGLEQGGQGGFAKEVKENLERARPLVMRTFANQPAARGLAPGTDLGRTPLLYWHPILILPGDGASLEFAIGANTAGYRLEIQAHTLDGRVGHFRLDVPAAGQK